MSFLTHSFRVKIMLILAALSLLLLSACGSTTGGNGGGGSSKVPITIGSKLDVENQLLAEMYSLLLTKAGYSVTTKLALGQTPTLSSAIKSGAISLYPEFTGTALSQVNASADAHTTHYTFLPPFRTRPIND